jgi:hypothetical protein
MMLVSPLKLSEACHLAAEQVRYQMGVLGPRSRSSVRADSRRCVWLAVLAPILDIDAIRLCYSHRASCELPRGSRTIARL